MEHEQIYKGQKVRIITSQRIDGTWRAQAELPDVGGAVVAREAYPSENEAYRAALSAAMAAVDRSRAKIGKP
ncbi:MAG: hypothetical protein JO189_18920 [Deltaproteobacteria bacterium]|nr:hypothetical protein [Deltaproteobacteria bacterium]